MGKLSLRYFGPVLWETMLPEKYKIIDNLAKFEDDIKDWVPDCKCRLCKTYVASEVFHWNIKVMFHLQILAFASFNSVLSHLDTSWI